MLPVKAVRILTWQTAGCPEARSARLKPDLGKPSADYDSESIIEWLRRTRDLYRQTRESETLYVARQPILDEQGRVFGYEPLYRGRGRRRLVLR